MKKNTPTDTAVEVNNKKGLSVKNKIGITFSLLLWLIIILVAIRGGVLKNEANQAADSPEKDSHEKLAKVYIFGAAFLALLNSCLTGTLTYKNRHQCSTLWKKSDEERIPLQTNVNRHIQYDPFK